MCDYELTRVYQTSGRDNPLGLVDDDSDDRETRGKTTINRSVYNRKKVGFRYVLVDFASQVVQALLSGGEREW